MRFSVTLITSVILLSIISCSTNVTLDKADAPDYQVFSRIRFDYKNMDIIEAPGLSQEIGEKFIEAYFHLERLKSSYSVQVVKELFETHERHPEIDLFLLTVCFKTVTG